MVDRKVTTKTPPVEFVEPESEEPKAELDESISKQLEAVQEPEPQETEQKKAEPVYKHKVVNRLPKRKKGKVVYEYMRTKELRKYAKDRKVNRVNTKTRRGLISALKKLDSLK